jgi:hypothetical protein
VDLHEDGLALARIAVLMAVAATVLEYGGDEDLAMRHFCMTASKIRAARQGLKTSATASGNASRGLSRPVPTASLIRQEASARHTGKSGKKPI